MSDRRRFAPPSEWGIAGLQASARAPMNWGMIETFVLLYGAAIVAGSWLMLKGVAEAPLGYEDEEGFHYAPIPVEERARAAAESVDAE